VTQRQARASWRWLANTFGQPSPAGEPAPRLAPSPEAILKIASWQWHAGWVQPFLARTLQTVASRATAIHRLAHQPLDVIVRELQTFRGICPFMIAETLQLTHGVAYLLSVGDLHLAHRIGEELTGRRTDDAGMLEPLAYWAGHRQ